METWTIRLQRNEIKSTGQELEAQKNGVWDGEQ